MKKKLIGGLFSVLYTALMIFSLFVQNSIVPALVTALTWVACLLSWGAVLLCLAGWYAGGTHRGGKAGADALFQYARKPGDQMGKVFTACDFSHLYGPRCHPGILSADAGRA